MTLDRLALQRAIHDLYRAEHEALGGGGPDRPAEPHRGQNDRRRHPHRAPAGSGNSNQNVEPCPCRLVAPISPPMSSTRLRLIARPSPVPP